jgi:allantoicase
MAIDGNVATRWTTGQNQMGNEWFLIDMGAVLPVSEVVLDDTSFPTDFPPTYTLEASTDGVTYTQTAMGAGAMVTTIQFAQRKARYIRINDKEMTAAPDGYWWSIDEIAIRP